MRKRMTAGFILLHLSMPAHSGSFFDVEETGTSPVSSVAQPVSNSLANRVLPFSQMSGASYSDIWKNGEYGAAGTVTGWQRGGTSNANFISDASGFSATVFRRGNDFAIAFRGSNHINDFSGANLQQVLFGPQLTGQYAAGLDMTKRLEANIREQLASEGYKGPINISLTGHSLGGGIAQYVASKNPQLNAVTFNAAGLQGLQYNRGTYYNIANFNSTADLVHKIPGTVQIGQEYTFDPKERKSNILHPIYNHSVDQTISTLKDRSEKYDSEKQLQAASSNLKSLGRQASSLPIQVTSLSPGPSPGSTPALAPNIKPNSLFSEPATNPQSGSAAKKTFGATASKAASTQPSPPQKPERWIGNNGDTVANSTPQRVAMPSALGDPRDRLTGTSTTPVQSKSQNPSPGIAPVKEAAARTTSASPNRSVQPTLNQAPLRTASFEVKRPYAPTPQPYLRPVTSANIAATQSRGQFGAGTNKTQQPIQGHSLGSGSPQQLRTQGHSLGSGQRVISPSVNPQRQPIIRSTAPSFDYRAQQRAMQLQAMRQQQMQQIQMQRYQQQLAVQRFYQQQNQQRFQTYQRPGNVIGCNALYRAAGRC